MGQQMSARNYYERGLVLKQVQMFPQAIQDFSKAALNPDCAGKAYVQIALCLKVSGRHEEAVMAFRQASVAPAVSSEEQQHILYHMGQTLELLERYAESLEVYGWIRRDAPGFRDVAQRIKYLSSGGRAPIPQSKRTWRVWMNELKASSRPLQRHVEAVLEQAWQWLRGQMERLKSHRVFDKKKTGSSGLPIRRVRQARILTHQDQPASRGRAADKRRHARAPVCLQSHFSTKGRAMTGEGVLRDLSPWGCRMTSFATVPVGESVECCIFLQGTANPVVIEGAVVRWISSREFGLSFTSVRPVVQRQIEKLCRAQAA